MAKTAQKAGHVRSRKPVGKTKLIGPRTYHPINAPLIARNYEDLVEQLRMRRIRNGLTQHDLDHIIGWQDGYTGKCEAPAGAPGRRRPRPISGLSDEWLQGLNVGIALVPLGPVPANQRKRKEDALQMELPF